MSISYGETHVDAILLGLQFTIQPFDLSKILGYSSLHFRESWNLFQNEKLLVVLPWSLCSRDFPIP